MKNQAVIHKRCRSQYDNQRNDRAVKRKKKKKTICNKVVLQLKYLKLDPILKQQISANFVYFVILIVKKSFIKQQL